MAKSFLVLLEWPWFYACTQSIGNQGTTSSYGFDPKYEVFIHSCYINVQEIAKTAKTMEWVKRKCFFVEQSYSFFTKDSDWSRILQMLLHIVF